MEIRPRSFGDSLGDLTAMLGKVWRPLLLPALASSVAVAVASYFILLETGALDVIDLTLNNPEFFETIEDERFLELMVDMGSGFVGVALASLVLYGYLYLVAARAVGNEVADQSTMPSATAAASRLYLTWLVTMVMVYAGVALGLVFLIIPGIWLGIATSMTTPVIGIEEAGPLTAIRRSYQLVRGNWWETFGFLFLVAVIGGTATQLIQLFAVPLFIVGSPSIAFGITVALALAVQGLIVAAIAVATCIWYLNLRARQDGPYTLQIS